MKYYIISHLTRLLLGKLRKYHRENDRLLVFSKDFIGEEVFAFGVYEKNELEIISQVLNEAVYTNTALDIGANIGNHAVQFSKLFTKVICFEPNETAFEVLKINTKNRKNITCFNFGLSNEDTTAYLQIPEKNLGGAAVLHSNNEGAIPIVLKKGDAIIVEPFSFIKIDVEGHEVEALKGLEHQIKKYKPVICFELITHNTSDQKLLKMLQELGYTSFYVPYEKSVFSTSKRKRFSQSFIDGLLYKKTGMLIAESNFNKPFYNLIFCENIASSFRIKTEAIRK